MALLLVNTGVMSHFSCQFMFVDADCLINRIGVRKNSAMKGIELGKEFCYEETSLNHTREILVLSISGPMHLSAESDRP